MAGSKIWRQFACIFIPGQVFEVVAWARLQRTDSFLNFQEGLMNNDDSLHYFAEIERRFQERRRAILALSTSDWALIESWRKAGIPLLAALRGIDAAFDRYEASRRRGRINGLAWCAQAVIHAAEELREA